MKIPVKSKEGIVKMREACAIAATVLEQLKPLVRPGITTQDLEEAGRDFIARLGARSACYGYQHGSRRYPAHTCISVNDEVVHGIPSFRRILREGDVVSLDIVVWHDGFIGDNAFTVPVGPVLRLKNCFALRARHSISESGRRRLGIASAMFQTPSKSTSKPTDLAWFATWWATGSELRCTSRQKSQISVVEAAAKKSNRA